MPTLPQEIELNSNGHYQKIDDKDCFIIYTCPHLIEGKGLGESFSVAVNGESMGDCWIYFNLNTWQLVIRPGLYE